MAAPAAKYDFKGKVSLVTGSSAGIGAEIAIQLGQYGSHVTITGRNADNLKKIAQQIEKTSNGVKPLQIVGDLSTDLDLPEKLVRETVAKYGRLDFVVNNAGVASVNETFDNVQLMEQYDRLMGLNVRSVLALTQLASKGIRVNAINPGPVFTSAGRTFGNENYFRENEELLKGMTSLKRVAEPEEIAQLAAFLLSDLAKNITGSIIVSDGALEKTG